MLLLSTMLLLYPSNVFILFFLLKFSATIIKFGTLQRINQSLNLFLRYSEHLCIFWLLHLYCIHSLPYI